MKPELDMCVIGGGAAGLVVAAGGASLGAKVALVEKRKLGGDCLHYGCVPSKSLLASAKAAHLMREAGRFGIDPVAPSVSVSRVMERVAEVIAAIQHHDDPQRFRNMGVDVIFGEGRFVGPDLFEVNGRRLAARNFVIATGSRPFVPDIEGIGQVPYLTNETVFDLREDVPRLAILGGGPIGVELAQAFARLGAEVHVMFLEDRIMAIEDADMGQVVAARLAKEGVRIYPRTTVPKVGGGAGDIRLNLLGPEGETVLNVSHFLVAAGRVPNVENLGLAEAGVAVDKNGVVTDSRLRTANRKIYACGDVTSPYRFTHVAEHHAGVVLRNALFHLPARVETRVIPWCTFTDPELARVGLSEQQAKEQNIPHRVYRFPFHDIDRAQAEAETDGYTKIVTDPGGRLLGACIAGPHAGELIHEYILALAKNMKAADLSGVIHIYPTLAQINRRVADQRMKQGLTPTAKAWIKRLFRLQGA